MRSLGWALGGHCPLLEGGHTCASELEEEAALGVWNAVRKAHLLGKRRSVTGVMNFGAYLSSITTTSSLRISQWTDFTSAQLSTTYFGPHSSECACLSPWSARVC